MIRNPDLHSFVCCATCSKIVPPPPSNTTFGRIREYKPFITRYYTHHDILEIGAHVEQEKHEKKEAEVQECIEKMKAEIWSQAETLKEDAVEKALNEAAAKHSAFVHDLQKNFEKKLKEEVMKAKAEMQRYMEEQQKREAEAAEQRMAHRLQRILIECAQDKTRAVAKARKQEREAAFQEAATLRRMCSEQLKEEIRLAEEQYHKSIEQLKKEKDREIHIVRSIIQKESETETEKQPEKAETLQAGELENVTVTLKAAEEQIKTLTQELEKVTEWKDILENEIQATRQTFQKYIDATFPSLSLGQADFILPFREAFQQKDTPEASEDSDSIGELVSKV
ncbi:uncharacterized protein C6orf163 homolog isoform X1 [Pezoporus wallicus]|uniref:uncharacterized protein C6orf163 homolog isoform X1 n=1 Tax=Pezoporus wallicus TaxID=35540 RepID=UPI00254D7CA8|nr:uncharacterized protein C6orf163 homolog isoform X1 [Pezoporus wallicus]